MNPVLKKLITKIPAQDAAWKLAHPALVALSDAAVAALASGPAPLTDTEKAALYVAGNTTRELRALILENGLVVDLNETKTEMADRLVAAGGDGVNTAAEDARAADYELYFAELLATLEAEATQRGLTFAGSDVEDLTIILITDDVTNSTTFDVS